MLYEERRCGEIHLDDVCQSSRKEIYLTTTNVWTFEICYIGILVVKAVESDSDLERTRFDNKIWYFVAKLS